MRSIRLFLVLVGFGCAPAARPSSVVPGIQIRATTGPGPDTIVYRRFVTRNNVDSGSGSRRVVLRTIDGPGGNRLLEVEQRFPGGGGEIVDTAVADPATFRAIAHRSHQPARTMRFDFSADGADGSVSVNGPAGDTARRVEVVHQALGGPIFDSNLIELVIAALPLRPRFAAELPFFIYERGGRVPMPVAVSQVARIRFPALGEHDV